MKNIIILLNISCVALSGCTAMNRPPLSLSDQSVKTTPATQNEDHVINCAADFDNNGTLNINDFQAFQNAYGALDPQADFNHDGQFNVLDFQAFLNAYSAGCP